jgi:hypothetical protein
MEGFGNDHSSTSTLVVGHKDIKTIDEAARLILEKLVDIDEQHRTFKFKIGSLFEHESAEVSRNFVQGRHLAALERLLDCESLNALLKNHELLILAIDEADKCPKPLAQLIRAISTHVQHEGIKTVRFFLAGVSPYFQHMLSEDAGVARFIYKTISLEPMSEEDATDLLQTKFAVIAESANRSGDSLKIDPDVIPRITTLSGGHPHLLQLLGSYVIEHENEDPDGVLDARDLLNSLERICYQDRAQAWDATIHMLTVEHEFDNLQQLLALTGRRFPTRIPRPLAEEVLGAQALTWFVDHDILTVVDESYYSFVDEFLRIRLMLDEDHSEAARRELESEIINSTLIEEHAEEILQARDVDRSPIAPQYLTMTKLLGYRRP